MLAALDGKNWNTTEYEDCDVALSMPRIETDTEQDLIDIMYSLGMENAFLKYGGHGFLDFCYFGDNEEDSDQCWISLMKQKAHLKLDEKGTEAAAITVIEVADKAAPRFVWFTADRPFFYIISEQSTGVIFFIGQFVGDTPTGISRIEQGERAIDSRNIYDLQGRRFGTDPIALKKGLYIVGGKKILIN